MIGLTRRHYQLLSFITEFIEKNDGVPPSFDEMKDGMELRSKSGIHRMIRALEERGYIRRLPNRARAIEVLAHPKRPVSIKPALWSAVKIWGDGRGLSVDEASASLLALGLHIATQQQQKVEVAAA